MITQLPVFVRDEQYRQNVGGHWRFTTLETIAIKIDIPSLETLPYPVLFRDKDGVEWARFQKGILYIRPHYSWDGCSPKARFAMLWLGTPDPPSTRLASLVHDVLYQFISTRHFPWSRVQADAAFYDCMKLSGFVLAGVFHGAVRKFGGLYVTNNDKTGVWSEELIPRKSNCNTDEAA